MDIGLVDQRGLDVSHEVESVSFRHFRPEEVKKLSRCKIYEERCFDDLGRTVENGLYDPRMGAKDFREGVCKACGMSYALCPGHFGHVSLPFPFVNPSCLQIVRRLLMNTCWECNKLRWDSRRKLLFLAILRFEVAQMPDCVSAVNYWMGTLTCGLRSGVEDELYKATLKSYFNTLPHKLKRALGDINPETVAVDMVDRVFQKVARKAWLKAYKNGALANKPSAKWNELYRAFMTDVPNSCPECDTKKVKIVMEKDFRYIKVFTTKEECMLFPSEVFDMVRDMWAADKDLFDMLFGQVGRFRKDPWEALDHNVFFVKNVAVPPNRFRPDSKVGHMENSSENPQNLAFLSMLEGINRLSYINSNLGISNPEVAGSAQSTPVRPNGNGMPKSILDGDGGDDDASSDDMHMDIEGDTNEKVEKVPVKEVSIADIRANRNISYLITQIQVGLCNLYDNQPTALVPFVGVRQQLEAKQGLFRMHMMGKRVNFSCRSVIGPDVFLETNEVGIPESFAKLLTVPEYVTRENIGEMRQAVRNGPNVYPGALGIEKWTADGKHRLTKLRGDSHKKTTNGRKAHADHLWGDEQGALPTRVLRHLRTGDVVLFNRQPTLHRVSILALKVRVLPGDRTIRFHYANCGSFNADFDGDEMNVHVLQDYLARAEAEELMLSSKHYIVPTSGAPVRGLIQDHVAAAAILSRKDTWLDKGKFCQLLYAATSTITARKSYKGYRYKVPEPTIIKPVPLWTGKQLITALFDIIRRDRPGLNLITRSKTDAAIVGKEESVLLIQNGRFLKGTMDKSSIGATIFGAVHGMHEVYGPQASDDFLSAFGKLGTFYLRERGHSTGISDLLLDERAETERHAIMKEKLNKAAIAATNHVYKSFATGKDNAKPAETLEEARTITKDMILAHGDKAEDSLDGEMKSALNAVLSEVTNACLPSGLTKKYPVNGFSLMTNTGAKGGKVNSAQISCLVGQTSLEGKRVPRMGGTGSTLPCFEPYDASPNAGGFISSRFLTGITPPEFFFHAMAGREGLLDTSLKTANSGYLQRCLVKALEGIKVNYDNTVRDSDGRIIQFIYGDDGLDPCKARWLTEKVGFQVENQLALAGEADQEESHPEVVETLRNGSTDDSTLLEIVSPGAFSKKGAVSEKFQENIDSYLAKNGKYNNRATRAFLDDRYQRCLIEPGEPVGVIAGHAIGEPSTQMTLNTFHHAGSSSAHVTLGIPRMRELLMGAAKYPKTPSMTLPIVAQKGKKGAEKLMNALRKVRLVDLISGIEITNKRILRVHELSDMLVSFVGIELKFPKPQVYEKTLGVEFQQVLDCIKERFEVALLDCLNRELARCARAMKGTDTAAAFRHAMRFIPKASSAEEDSIDVKEDGDEEEEEEAAKKDKPTEKDKDFIEEDEEGAVVEKQDKDVDNMEGVENNGADSDDNEDAESVEYDENEDKEDPIESDKDDDSDDDVSKSKEKTGDGDEKMGVNEDSMPFKLGPLDEPRVNSKRDTINLAWVFPMCMTGRIRIPELVREAAEKVDVRAIKRIGRCFVESTDGGYSVITEGSNLLEIMEKGSGIVDLDKLVTNDMFGLLRRYGVEALRVALIQEFAKVFEAYGIPVNIRHLTLIADYMTAHGGYRGFNRRDMKEVPSPFQKITFETSVKFLTEAAMFGTKDDIRNPSAAIAVGANYRGGTGMVELLSKLN